MELVQIPKDIASDMLIEKLDEGRYQCPIMFTVPTGARRLKRSRSDAFIFIRTYSKVVLVFRDPKAIFWETYYSREVDFEDVRNVLLDAAYNESGYSRLFDFIKELVGPDGSTYVGLDNAFRAEGAIDIHSYLLA